MLEQTKADKLNETLELEDPHKLTGDDVILCSTPFKDLVEEYKDQWILVAGMGDTVNVAHEYGFKNALHVHEYTSIFPHLAPLTTKYRSEEKKAEYLQNVYDRLGMSFDIEDARRQGESSIKFGALFVFHDVDEMEESLQVF